MFEVMYYLGGNICNIILCYLQILLVSADTNIREYKPW